MNRIREELENKVAIVPVSQTAGGNTTSAYIDACGYNALDFVISHGALAAGKKITVQLYHAADTSGTGAAEIEGAKHEFASPTGGVTSGIITISIRPQAGWGSYFAVKVTNDAAAAVLIAATAHGRVKLLPAENAEHADA